MKMLSSHVTRSNSFLKRFIQRLDLLSVLVVLSMNANAQALSAPAGSVMPAENRLLTKALASVQRAGLPANALYLTVLPVGQTQPAVSVQGNSAVNPASLMKLVTTVIALDTLGPQFQWETRFLTNAPAVDGHITDLFIQGSGDPAFRVDDIDAVFKQLRSQGIDRIDGSMVLDRSRWPTWVELPPIDDAPYRSYHAQPNPLLMNHGSTAILIVPKAGEIQVSFDEAPKRWVVKSTLAFRQGPCRPWKDTLTVNWQFAPDVQLLVSGEYPVACGAQRLPIRIPNYDVMWRDWASQLWSDQGGVWSTPAVRTIKAPKEAYLLASLKSKPLSELIRDMNKFSSNVMAQNLAATITLNRKSNDYGKVAQQWLTKNGIDTNAWLIDSGSGLSRTNRLTTDGLARLLNTTTQQGYFPDLMNSLPVAGVDGTLTQRLRTGKGEAYLKTGRLADTAGLAGYIKDQRGDLWVMVAILSHPQAPNHVKVLDEITEFVMKGTQ